MGPPEAAGFLVDWTTRDGAVHEADPVFWGAFFSPQVVDVNVGFTCIQMKAKWTVALELFD